MSDESAVAAPRFFDVAVSGQNIYGVDKDGIYEKQFAQLGADWSPVAFPPDHCDKIVALDVDALGTAWAVGSDNKIYRRPLHQHHGIALPGAPGQWSNAVRGRTRGIAVDGNSLYVIGMNHHIYMTVLDSPAPSWSCIAEPVERKDTEGIAVCRGSLFCISRGSRIYMRTAVGNEWELIGGRATAICACAGELYVIGQAPQFDLFKRVWEENGCWEKLSWFVDPFDATLAWLQIEDGERFDDVEVISDSESPQYHLRLVCISDTHGRHRLLDVSQLKCDVLIHAGDLSSNGTANELSDIFRFFAELIDSGTCQHVVAVPGNHDSALQNTPEVALGLHEKCRVLRDEAAHILGLTFFGTPWQPEYFGHAETCRAFTLPRGDPLRSKWDNIAEDVDVLIVHGPPLGRGDKLRTGKRVGCHDLLNAVRANRPRVVVSGHIHEGYGYSSDGTTVFINAASVCRGKPCLNDPICVHLPFDKSRPARVSSVTKLSSAGLNSFDVTIAQAS